MSDDALAKPFRLNHSEIIALALSRGSGVGESAEVTRNAKGEWQFQVSARTAEGETLDDAVARLQAAVAKLAAAYPYPQCEDVT